MSKHSRYYVARWDNPEQTGGKHRKENELTDLQVRLIKSIRTLEGMIANYEREANTGHPDSRDAIREILRLRGKVQGVKLALSYVEEDIRLGRWK